MAECSSRAAVSGKARSPKVKNRVRRTTNVTDLSERSLWLCHRRQHYEHQPGIIIIIIIINNRNSQLPDVNLNAVGGHIASDQRRLIMNWCCCAVTQLALIDRVLTGLRSMVLQQQPGPKKNKTQTTAEKISLFCHKTVINECCIQLYDGLP